MTARAHGGWRRPAAAGALIWGALALAGAVGIVSLGWIPLLFLLAPLVVVPLGLGLVAVVDDAAPAPRSSRWVGRLAPVAAGAAVLAFLLPVGSGAAVAAGLWFLLTVLVGVEGIERALRALRGRRLLLPHVWPAVAALLYLPVGGAWFVLSRAGARPMDFFEPIVLLTAVHFHFTAFAAPLFAAAAARRLRRGRRPLAICSAGLVIAPAVLAVAWTFALIPLKVAATLLLGAALVGVAGLTVLQLGGLRSAGAQALLSLAAASVAFGMVLAGVYAFGELHGIVYLDIPRMARLHGVANGVAFSALGLLGWLLALGEPGGIKKEDGS